MTDDESGAESAGDKWHPEAVDVDDAFDDGGETARDDAAVVSDPGDFLREDHWFEGERDITARRGVVLLIALAGAGLYASSFVFAAIGLQFVAPPAAQTYLELVLSAMFFLPIPMVAYLAVGVGIEAYTWRRDGEIPETTLPLALLVPVVLHVSLFFVEWVEFGYSTATLADLFAREPGLAQLLLWPPVIVGTIYAVIVYRASIADLARTEDAAVEGGQHS